MTSALYGLFGAAIIGTSDALTRVTGRRLPVLLLTTLLFLLSLPPLAVYMSLADAWPPLDWNALGVAALSGFFNAVGLALLFMALARGPIAVASPAASSFSIFLIALNVLDGAPFRTGHGIAAVLMGVAVLLLAAPERRRGASESEQAALGTALLALGAAFMIALRMFTAQEIADPLGAAGATFASRLVAGLCTGAALLVWLGVGRRIEPQPVLGVRRYPPVWILVLLQSALEASALFVFLVGSSGAEGDRVATVIGFSAFAAFSPLAAWLLWGDRISLRRGLCIALAMIGAAVAALA